MKKIKYGLVVTGLALSTLFSQVFSQEREYSGHNLEEKRDISSSLPEYLSEIGEIASSGAADLLEQAKEEGKDGQTLAPDSAEYSATLDRFESLKEIVFRMASSISPDLVLKGLGYGLGSLVLWKGIQTLRDIMGYGINPLTLLVLPFQVLGVISIMYGRTIYNVEQGIIAVSAVLVALAGAYTLLTQAEEEARAGKLTDKEAVIIEQKVKSILTNSEQSFQV